MMPNALFDAVMRPMMPKPTQQELSGNAYPDRFIAPPLLVSRADNALLTHHNANLRSGKAVINDDGSISTIKTMIVPDWRNRGKFVIVPTIWDGQDLSGDPRKAVRRAIEARLDWPSFGSPEEADAWDQRFHRDQGMQ
jgi:hypothetical protein